jgi:acetylcholinesterase
MQYYSNIPSEGVPYGQFGNNTFPSLGTQWRRVASITGDVLFIGPCRLFSSANVNASSKIYHYRLNVTDPSFDATLGSTHGIDINYVWNNPTLKNNSTDVAKTVDFMSRAWAAFVVDQNPNGHGVSGVANWNPYSADSKGQNFVIQVGKWSTESDTFRKQGIDVINTAVLRL